MLIIPSALPLLIAMLLMSPDNESIYHLLFLVLVGNEAITADI